MLAQRDIAALVAEHRACVKRAGELRDDVLRRMDDVSDKDPAGGWSAPTS